MRPRDVGLRVLQGCSIALWVLIIALAPVALVRAAKNTEDSQVKSLQSNHRLMNDNCLPGIG